MVFRDGNTASLVYETYSLMYAGRAKHSQMYAGRAKHSQMHAGHVWWGTGRTIWPVWCVDDRTFAILPIHNSAAVTSRGQVYALTHHLRT